MTSDYPANGSSGDPAVGSNGLHADVRATVGEFVLDCQLDVPPGASLAVVGPNGSGKSTLLKALSGLTILDRGSITISGQVVADSGTKFSLAPEKRNIALMPQKALLFPHLNVADNVGFGLRYRKRPDSDTDDGDAVTRVLEDVGLSRFGDRKPSELSGGQQQRAALARALVMQPNLLLVDEPLSNVDADSRHHLRSVMQRWHSANQIQVIATHGRQHSRAADLLLGLEGGRVAAFGSPSQLASETKLGWLRDLLCGSD